MTEPTKDNEPVPFDKKEFDECVRSAIRRSKERGIPVADFDWVSAAWHGKEAEFIKQEQRIQASQSMRSPWNLTVVPTWASVEPLLKGGLYAYEPRQKDKHDKHYGSCKVKLSSGQPMDKETTMNEQVKKGLDILSTVPSIDTESTQTTSQEDYKSQEMTRIMWYAFFGFDEPSSPIESTDVKETNNFDQKEFEECVTTSVRRNREAGIPIADFDELIKAWRGNEGKYIKQERRLQARLDEIQLHDQDHSGNSK